MLSLCEEREKRAALGVLVVSLIVFHCFPPHHLAVSSSREFLQSVLTPTPLRGEMLPRFHLFIGWLGWAVPEIVESLYCLWLGRMRASSVPVPPVPPPSQLMCRVVCS